MKTIKLKKIKAGDYDVLVDGIKKYEITNVKDYHPVEGNINLWNVKFENNHEMYGEFETKYFLYEAKEFINKLEGVA